MSDETQDKPTDNPTGSLRVMKHRLSQDAIETLEGILARARAGEIIGFCGVLFLLDLDQESICTEGMSRHQVAGAMMNAAMLSLGYDSNR